MAFMVWWSVYIQVINPNVSLATSEDVLAALPIRAIRDKMNGNHTALINPAIHDRAWPVSHKVWAA